MNIHHDVRCTLPHDHEGECSNKSRIVISVVLEIDEESMSAAEAMEEVQAALEGAIDTDNLQANLVWLLLAGPAAMKDTRNIKYMTEEELAKLFKVIDSVGIERSSALATIAACAPAK